MKRGLKRAVCLLSTVGLVCAMGISALAAGSPAINSGTGVDKNGNNIQVNVSTADTSDPVIKDAVEELKDSSKLEIILKDEFSENMTLADVKDVTVPDGTVFPVELTFEVPGVAEGTNVILLHWNGSSWDKIPTTVKNGVVVGTFDSLSPVAIIVEKESGNGGTEKPGNTTPDSNTSSTKDNTTTTSPKTGVNNLMLIFAGMTAVAALAGVILLKTRETAK